MYVLNFEKASFGISSVFAMLTLAFNVLLPFLIIYFMNYKLVDQSKKWEILTADIDMNGKDKKFVFSLTLFKRLF